MPSGLVADYQNYLSQGEELYRKFLDVRNSISSSDSDSEVENVSMVEGLQLYEKIEHLKQKLKLIENPLLRYLVGLMRGGDPMWESVCRKFFTEESTDGFAHVLGMCLVTKNTVVSKLKDRGQQEPRSLMLCLPP